MPPLPELGSGSIIGGILAAILVLICRNLFALGETNGVMPGTIEDSVRLLSRKVAGAVNMAILALVSVVLCMLVVVTNNNSFASYMENRGKADLQFAQSVRDAIRLEQEKKNP